jgi:hypothetical protein
MGDTASKKGKKALQAAYRERAVKGGIYAIRNTDSGRLLVEQTADMQGSANRFEFMKSTGACFSLKLQKDWKPGAATFAFEILEELDKGADQTDAEFRADLAALKELWLDKLSGAELYG